MLRFGYYTCSMSYFAYILTNRTRTLYIGVTNDIVRRIYKHRSEQIPGFTSKYKIHRLVYFEQFDDIRLAIAREKDLKGWSQQEESTHRKRQSRLEGPQLGMVAGEVKSPCRDAYKNRSA